VAEVRIAFVVDGGTAAERALAKVAEAGGRIDSIRTASERAGQGLERMASVGDRALSGLGDTAKRVFEIFTGFSLTRIV
jgi:hypothetical protein